MIDNTFGGNIKRHIIEIFISGHVSVIEQIPLKRQKERIKELFFYIKVSVKQNIPI